MADGTGLSEILGMKHLSDVGKKLIDKVSKGAGVIYEPTRIERKAKAEAKADMIKAQSALDISDLQRRTFQRISDEETNRQQNMEAITEKAIPLLEDKAAPENIENDWVANLYDKNRLTSDEEMQDIWARILAGEANNPGSFSKKTVNLVADLSKTDAECFKKLCGFAWMIGRPTPVITDLEAPIYKNNGITFSLLVHLESLGLLHFNHLTGYLRIFGNEKPGNIFYYGKPLKITPSNQGTRHAVGVGNVLLTQAGEELAAIGGSSPVDGFYDYAVEYWKNLGNIPELNNSDSQTLNG